MKTNTPTPNEVLTELSGVLHRIPQAHRDIIVTAVNSHEELLAASRNALNVLAALATGQLGTISKDSNAIQQLRQAIAKAEGRI